MHLRDRIEVARIGEGFTLVTTQVDAPLGNLMPRLELGRSLGLAAFRWDGQTLRSVPLPFDYSPESHPDARIVDLRVADWTGDGVDDLVLGVLVDDGPWSLWRSGASRLLIFPGRRA